MSGSVADRVRVREIKVLSDNWYVLRKATFDWRRNDGTWQTQEREAYDRGDGVALLAGASRILRENRALRELYDAEAAAGRLAARAL